MLSGLLLLSGCGSSEGRETGAAVTGLQVSDDDGFRGILLDAPYALPQVRLTDTEGRPFDVAAQGRRTLVFFGYTSCPDICQVVMSTIASALVKLPATERKKVQVVFVTTDPARDTESVLRTYLDHYDPDFVGVTGSIRSIDALGRSMGIEVTKGQKLPDGGYEVTHTTNVTAVHDGRADLLWTASTSPSDMAIDLRKILKADA